jgi:hypothetical protein
LRDPLETLNLQKYASKHHAEDITMRTTLTIDDDVAARLRRLGAGRGVQKRLINDLLRVGLDRMEHREPTEGPPFRTATHRLGARVPSLDNVAEVLATSEAEDWR